MPNHRKPSHYLSDKHGHNIIHAAGLAEQIGTPFTNFPTYLLADRYPLMTCQDLTRLITKRYTDFAHYRCIKPAWAYILENGKDNGEHAHFFMHVPNGVGRKFWPAAKNWVRHEVTDYRAQGDAITVKTEAISNQRVWGADGFIDEHSHLKSALLYVLKGLEPGSELATFISDCSLTAKRKNPPWQTEPQGIIQGLRCRVSDNIGWAARARFENKVIPFPEVVAPPSEATPMRA